MRYLFLLRQFVRRDFESRYAGSMLGFLWSLLLPAWQLVLFTFVFATVLKISLLGERTENFGVFLFCGLIPWLAVHEGVSRAATAITDNGNLVKKIHFPAEILVLSVVLGAVVHQAITTGVFLLVLLGLGELSWATLPLLLVAVPLQITLTLGMGLMVATVHTFLRDVAQLLGMLLMGWFYLTPIVYPLNQVPESLRGLIGLNPMAVIVDLYRSALLGGALPSWQGFLPLPVAALILLLIGGFLFRRSKRAFADEL